MTGDRIAFLGLDFDRLDPAALRDTLAGRDRHARFAYWVTPNVDHIVRLHDEDGGDRALIWSAYQRADWCSCDSRILAVLARRQGIDLPVAPGSDMTPMLLGTCRAGDRIALIGGTVATRDALTALYPHIEIVQHMPPMGMRRNPAAMAAAAAFVAEARARYAFLAVGSPQQELLAAAIAARGDATGIGLCIGASIEFVVGEAKRAPRLIQRLHLEWAHRLLSDPRRLWKRYLVTGPRIFALARRRADRPPGA